MLTPEQTDRVRHAVLEELAVNPRSITERVRTRLLAEGLVVGIPEVVTVWREVVREIGNPDPPRTTKEEEIEIERFARAQSVPQVVRKSR